MRLTLSGYPLYFLLAGSFVGILIWAVWPLPSATSLMTGQAGQVSPKQGQGSGFKAVGVGSCSAAACHNAPPSAEPKRSEYALWASRDPHSRAYAVLYEPRSQQIQKRRLTATPAHEDPLCLKCHVSQNYQVETQNPRYDLADGVQCESCHGPAEAWLVPHTRPGWAKLTDAEKRSLGFRPLKNLQERAKSCLECHVGSPRTGADVNHDLIAAGHPRLYFELSSHLARYPKHWKEAGDKDRFPDYQARIWALGQVAAAQQALDLLAWRAGTSESGWPELAEFDCYACHHLIRPDPLEDLAPADRPLGFPPANRWYTASLPLLARAFAAGDLAEQTSQLWHTIAAQPGDPRGIVAESRTLSSALDRVAAAINTRPSAANTWTPLFRLVTQGDAPRPRTWDEGVQLYLALQALCKSLEDLEPSQPQVRQVKQVLPGLKRTLAFPPGYENPAPDFRPRLLHELLESLGPRPSP
jgi:hypothetical protein